MGAFQKSENICNIENLSSNKLIRVKLLLWKKIKKLPSWDILSSSEWMRRANA